MSITPRTLLLVPTELERACLARQPGFGVDSTCKLCGFGPVAAAARTSSLIARYEPARVILVGIAGTFDSVALPVGGAAVFARVLMHGVGVGNGVTFISADALGFQQWEEDGIGDELSLAVPVAPVSGALLTCASAAASPDEAAKRRVQVPEAVAEDMEGFAVALACRLADVPLVVVRGISNEVGDRQVNRWHLDDALVSAWIIATDLVARRSWESIV